MMRGNDRIYQHSGKVPLLALALTIVIAHFGIRFMAAIYGFAMFASFLIVLNALFPFLYGIAVGAVIGVCGHFGKIRNIWVMALLGLAGGLWADYWGWSEWVYYPFEETRGDKAHTTSIPQIFEYAKEFAREGGYVLITGTEIKGWLLWAGWVLEFITVVGMSVMFAALIGSMGHFCERCRRWTDQEFKVAGIKNVPSKEVSQKTLAGGDFSGLLNAGWASLSDKSTISLKVDHCTGCGQLHVLNLSRVREKKDAEGKRVKESRGIISNLLITPQEFEKIRELKRGRPKEVRRAEARSAGD